jgi:hypothetical protein
LDHQHLSNLKKTPSQNSRSAATTVSSQMDIAGCSHESDIHCLNASYIQKCFQNILSMTALSDLDSTQELSQSTGLEECCIHLIIVPTNNDNSEDTTPPAILPSDNGIVRRKSIEVPDKKVENMLETSKLSALSTSDNAIFPRKPIEFPDKKEENLLETSELPVLNTSYNAIVTRKPTEVPEKKVETMLETLTTPALKTEDGKTRTKWVKINRDFEEEVRYNYLLHYTMPRLVKRWAEYLTFTPEQMRLFELENARNSDLTDDVIEIFENPDLHVWQILDMINYE